MKKLKAILIGAGGRGIGYSEIMANSPEKFEIIAVAEPNDSRRNYIKNLYNLPDEMCFTDYPSLIKLGKIADFAILATMDREHFEPAIELINLKYDILLEKPIAPTPQECVDITRAAKENNVKVVICTVLRYTPIFITIKNLIDSGKIGKVVSINHEENVGNIHQSHSFVRGKWCNEGRSSNMLLQKTCHDFDIIQWLLGKKCKSVQSFGGLSYFVKENAPEGAPDYCIDNCPYEKDCRFSSLKVYLHNTGFTSKWFRGACASAANPTDEQVEKAIRETQYGKCVFKCDNDVVDHQTVNMLFEDNITVTFSMNAFNKGGRVMHIYGTEGEIKADMNGEEPIKIYNFNTDTEESIDYSQAITGIPDGHGGGDEGIIKTLYDYITGDYDGKSVPTIEESCYNHLITFAAEESRLTNKIIDVEEYIASF